MRPRGKRSGLLRRKALAAPIGLLRLGKLPELRLKLQEPLHLFLVPSPVLAHAIHPRPLPGSLPKPGGTTRCEHRQKSIGPRSIRISAYAPRPKLASVEARPETRPLTACGAGTFRTHPRRPTVPSGLRHAVSRAGTGTATVPKRASSGPARTLDGSTRSVSSLDRFSTFFGVRTRETGGFP